MNKSEFIHQFIDCPGDVKIRVTFDIQAFLDNNTIVITKDIVLFRDVFDFYVPKYEKSGKFDTRTFDEQVLDPNIQPLSVGQAIYGPTKLDLTTNNDNHPIITHLHLIPIATDSNNHKTLILDSNHTIVALLKDADQETLDTTKLSVIRLSGFGLDEIIPDFEVLGRIN